MLQAINTGIVKDADPYDKKLIPVGCGIPDAPRARSLFPEIVPISRGRVADPPLQWRMKIWPLSFVGSGFLYFSIVYPEKLCYNANIYNYFYKQEIFTYE